MAAGLLLLLLFCLAPTSIVEGLAPASAFDSTGIGHITPTQLGLPAGVRSIMEEVDASTIHARTPSSEVRNSTRQDQRRLTSETDDADSLCAFYNSLSSETTSLYNWCGAQSGGSYKNGPCTGSRAWVGVTCNSGRVTEVSLPFRGLSGSLPTEVGLLTGLTRLSFRTNYLSGPMPTEIGQLWRLTYLDLSGNSFSSSIPHQIGQLSSLTYLDLSGNSFSRSIPTQLGLLREIINLDLSSNRLRGTIPFALTNLRRADLVLNLNSNYAINGTVSCKFARGGPSYTSLLAKGTRVCYPRCFTPAFRFKKLRSSSYFLYTDDYASSYDYNTYYYGYDNLCNDTCSTGQYYHQAPVNFTIGSTSNGECKTCGNFSTSILFSIREDDCKNIIANVAFSLLALITSVVLSLIYIFYGRFHYVAFIRFERLVLKLIEKYKMTIHALVRLKQNFKARRALEKSRDLSMHSDRSLEPDRRMKVVAFFAFTSLIFIFLPLLIYSVIIWKRMLDTLIMWNGMKSQTRNYSQTLTRAIRDIGMWLSMPAVIDALFSPFRHILVALSKIRIDFGAVKVTCPGAEAPLNLLIQVVVLGVAIIVIESDYQIFKVSVFKRLLDFVKAVVGSSAYRRFALREDERFRWSFWRYTRFLLYIGCAEAVSAVLDFPTILKFFMAIVKFDSVTFGDYWYYPLRRFLLWFFLYPFFGIGVFIDGSTYYYGLASNPACDAVPGLLKFDTRLLLTTYAISLMLIIPVLYEVGKVIVPGNRSRRDISLGSAKGRGPDDLKLMGSVEPYSFFFGLEWAGWPKRAFETILWSFSFVSLDLWMVWLAERWLRLIHTAIPPSHLPPMNPNSSPPGLAVAISSSESSSSDGHEHEKYDKHASLGWGRIMREVESHSITSSLSLKANVMPATDVVSSTSLASKFPSCPSCPACPLHFDGVFASVRTSPPAERYALHPPEPSEPSEPSDPAILASPEVAGPPLGQSEEGRTDEELKGEEAARPYSRENVNVRYAEAPPRDEEEELARWVQHCQHGVLPTYSEFISIQYRRMLRLVWQGLRVLCCCGGLYTREQWQERYVRSMSLRLFCKLVASVLVWYGFGNFTRGARTIWYHIFRNYALFFISSLGIWTAEARRVYCVEECIQATAVDEEGTEGEGERDGTRGPDHDVTRRWTEYTAAWSAILSPRAILYMVIPRLTPVMLFATIVSSNSPLWIADPGVPRPPLLDLTAYYRKAEREGGAAEDQRWLVWADAIYLFAAESRLVQSVINAYKFVFVMVLWRCGSRGPQGHDGISALMVSSLVLLFPYCLALSLKPVVFLGHTLGIRDEDFGFTRPPTAAVAGPPPGDPTGPTCSPVAVDVIPQPRASPLPRPSAVSLDAVYRGSLESLDGQVQMGAVGNPLRRLPV